MFKIICESILKLRVSISQTTPEKNHLQKTPLESAVAKAAERTFSEKALDFMQKYFGGPTMTAEQAEYLEGQNWANLGNAYVEIFF